MSSSKDDRDELITKFMSITGSNNDRAQFFLESAQWDLNEAVQAFFDEAGTFDPLHYDNSSDEDILPEKSANIIKPIVEGQKQHEAKIAPRNKIATIASFQNSRNTDDDQQAYYAGGSEHGAGQQILGPTMKKNNDFVKDLFESARHHGAEDVQHAASEKENPNMKKSFGGTGYKLGDSEGQSFIQQAHPQDQFDQKLESKKEIILKMWRNGFSVNDGPLREYSDPANKSFLESIKKGQVPKELISSTRGHVDLAMEDHREEDYVKPKQSDVTPFAGTGQRLGSPVATILSSALKTVPLSGSDTAPSIEINTTLPVTQLQIRLADGKRLVGKFNHTHHVSDVRDFIIHSHPEYSNVNFILMTNFPNEEITNEFVTLSEAKLLNAVLVQKLK